MLVCPLAAQLLSKDEITARVEANQAVEGDAVQEEAAKIWGEALVELEAAADARELEKKVRADLQDLTKPVELTLPAVAPPGAPLAAQEEALQRIEAQIAENEALIKAIGDSATQSTALGAALTAEKATLEAELNQLEIPAAATGELEAARYQKAVQTKDRIEAKLAEIAARKEFNEMEDRLFAERLTAAKKHDDDLESLRAKVETRIEKLEKEEAENARQAIAELNDAFEGIPELAGIVGELQEIRESQDRVDEMVAEAKAYSERIDEIGKNIQKQFTSAKQRIDLLEGAKLGVDDETGMLLRQQRARLPSVDDLSGELRDKLELAAKASMSSLDVTARQKTLPVLKDKMINNLLKEHPEISRERIEELFNRRSEALNELSAGYTRHNEELTKGTTTARQAIFDIEKYSNYIDKRLLWIKSAKPFSLSEPMAEWGRLMTLFGPEMLASTIRSVRDNFFGKIVKILVVVIIAAAIFLRRRKLREILKTSSEKAARRNCTSVKPTLEYLGAAVLLALWLPLLVWVFASLVQEPDAWREGLLRLAVFFFLSALFLKFSRPNGLFVSHFRIHPDRSALFHRNLKWLTPIAPPFVFLVPALTSMGNDPAAGRLAFILGMFLLAAFCHHLFSPKWSILQKEGKSTGFTKGCYFLIMLCPVVFIIGAVLGYFESVLTLRDQVGATAGLLVLAFLVTRFLTRWTLVSRRGLAISQALRRREAALAEDASEAEDEGRDLQVPNLEEVKAEAVDVVEVEEQTKKLLKIAVYSAVFFGLWGIWSSTFTALTVLDKVHLWGESKPVAASTASSPSLVPSITGPSEEKEKAAPNPVAEIIPEDDGRVTLQDVLLTLVFLVLTFVAASNIPGVLSLVLFSRINMGPGGNFALTTTFRYLIVLAGIVIALGQIGITWGKVQWLAAAVTLGIGFGLQEIFANFVAGIILLFERPIRIGDIVTVGDISGSVTQIRIRATTIKQFNRRELLVPNKEFITSQLVNWTLNDSILRLEVPVGIAYGSDTGKATQILEKLLKDHPHVMEDPGPVVLFMTFGNSTLDFEARAFVASAEFLLSTKSELHYQIDNAFREAGIEIAFPQQDVHVRSLPEGMKPVQSS